MDKFIDSVLIIGFFVILFIAIVQNLPAIHEILNILIK